MEQRKLASIQRVESLSPIEGADRIVKAQVMGWQVVTQKDNFKPGDLCVFFEIDSVLPDTEWAAFLGDKKRIKTIRLKGVVSQGLILPLQTVGIDTSNSEVPIQVGEDLTELLGVTKYEAPECKAITMGDATGGFPQGVPKTNEPRVQSYGSLLKEMQGLPYYISLKYHGMSSTYGIDSGTGEFYSASREWKKKADSVYGDMARKYNLEEKLRDYPNLVLQGEIVGEKIERNTLGIQGRELYIFNVFDIEERQYLSFREMLDICEKLDLNTVEILEVGDSFNYTLEELLVKAEGTYDGTNNPREGIVIRPQKERPSTTQLGRLSFKVINNAFLLKEK